MHTGATARVGRSLGVLALLAGLAACTGDEPRTRGTDATGTPTGSVTEPVTELVPVDTGLLGELVDRSLATPKIPPTYLTVVDLAAARAAAGLDPSADPTDRDVVGSGSWILGGAQAAALPFTSEEGLLEVIDPTQVTAAVSAGAVAERVQVLHTDQDAAELRAGLEDLGYVADGDVLTYQGEAPATRTVHHVALADGLVALAGDRRAEGADAARAALAQSPATTPQGALAAELTAGTGAAGVTILSGFEGGAWSCLEAVAVVEPFSGQPGEMVFVPATDPADVEVVVGTESLHASDLASYTFGEPETDGDLVRVSMARDEADAAPGLLDVRTSGYPAEAVARCD
ncbi:hypothetical protein DDE18_01150 [Nocardioides gansuensis]|uniref:Uncharacterized protein n=1 Tax=Nocardioides gansuensis TaxID=2138300 RepID=A0A2T8FF05_9ACTN|nr:hypothetical protein [Nocardioides gansuensis]PVG84270.1 hypothetical protein DDE18_01150 [Nocardioides gansuensis]